MADETYDDARERLRAERRETEQRLAGLTGSFTDIVDAAESSNAAGTYGVCESCGGPIAPSRLEARPVARECIACAGRRTTTRP